MVRNRKGYKTKNDSTDFGYKVSSWLLRYMYIILCQYKYKEFNLSEIKKIPSV